MSDPNLLDHATTRSVRRELETIGNLVNVWRLRGENDWRFAHRIALALEESICEREDLLDIVISLRSHPTCNPAEQSP
jgi:hypothetical protein